MLRGTHERTSEIPPTELRGIYDDRLAETIERAGRESVLEATSVEEDTVRGLCAGESPELRLETAAEILALDRDLPDAGSIAAEARDLLVMKMATAVLDAEEIVSGIGNEIEPEELRQKVAGQTPMTLDEYALVQSHIEQHDP